MGLGDPDVAAAVTGEAAEAVAVLAGLGAGFWSTPEELARCRQTERSFEPAMSRDQAAARMRQWEHAVRCTRGYAG